MATLQSELGNRYGRLVVIDRAKNQGTRAQWLCRCDCGAEKIVSGKHLRRGTTTSCGCVRRETSAKQGRLNKMPETEVRRRCSENGFELLSEYKGTLHKSRFRCLTCGYEFERRAEASIYGTWGCDRCSKRDYDFNRKSMIESDEVYANKKAFLYLMQLTGNGEAFYKIGFTSQGIQQRIRKIPYVMTDIEVIETTVKRAYALESEIKAVIAPYRYRPNLDFAGCAECFKPAPLLNKTSEVA